MLDTQPSDPLDWAAFILIGRSEPIATTAEA